MATSIGNIVLKEATIDEVDSMATIVPRAYAPDAFLPQIIPDTSIIRQWWVDTYKTALKDPAARLLVAVHGTRVVGVFTMHYLGPDSRSSTSSGVTTTIPLTQDHSSVLVEAFAGLKREREELMGDAPHFLVELVGVDKAYQDLGIGRRLTQWACEIADDQDAAIYLQTSAAVHYYTKKLNLAFVTFKTDPEDAAGGTIVRSRLSTRQIGKAVQSS